MFVNSEPFVEEVQPAKLITLYTPTQIVAKIYALITFPILDLILLQTIQANSKPTSFSHITTSLHNTRDSLYNSTIYNSLERLDQRKHITTQFIEYRGKQVRRWTITAKGKRLLKSINSQVFE